MTQPPSASSERGEMASLRRYYAVRPAKRGQSKWTLLWPDDEERDSVAVADGHGHHHEPGYRRIEVVPVAELEHARMHRPTDRPDAHCVDCPFSDRGDFLVYREEWDAMKREIADLNAELEELRRG